MFTVAILINGNPVMARSARDVTSKKLRDAPIRTYKIDTGKFIRHKKSDGALVLAHKLLDTMKT